MSLEQHIAVIYDDVLDALDSSSSTLHYAATWSTYRQALACRPNVITPGGVLTRHGLAVQNWLHDNNYRRRTPSCRECGR